MSTQAPNDEILLEVKGLKKHFPIHGGVLRRVVGQVKAVDGISVRVYRGQTLGLVGESGCVKTTTGRAILKLVPLTAGSIAFDGVDLAKVRGEELRQVRRRLQIIFQDPYSSLNPRMTVESMLLEAMKMHGLGDSRKQRRERAAELLTEVGLEPLHDQPADR